MPLTEKTGATNLFCFGAVRAIRFWPSSIDDGRRRKSPRRRCTCREKLLRYQYLAQRVTAVQVQAMAPSVHVFHQSASTRSVWYPLGTPTSAINQTTPAAAVEVSYVPLIRTNE